MTPKTSRTLKFPHVPNEFQAYFVREYFDRDGCIYRDKNFINIVGGSNAFLESLVKVIDKQNIKATLKTVEKNIDYISVEEIILKNSFIGFIRK